MEIKAQNNDELLPYRIYNQDGKVLTFNQLSDIASHYDVVFFGELHNNTIAHWLQLHLVKKLYAKNQNIVLGAEMFETDQQLIINEYLADWIQDKQLEAGTHMWSNYSKDYKALLQFAKANQLPFVATNVPRRYASMVSNYGLGILDSVSELAKQFLPAQEWVVAYELSSYQEMKEMMGAHAGDRADNFVAAQALKDACMANRIAQHIQQNGIFVHFNGSYHSDRHEGIVHYLKQINNDLKILVITTKERENVEEATTEDWKMADISIIVRQDFPKSY